MKVTVVGGGNVGTQFAAHLAAAGHEVTVSASKANKFERHLKVIDGAGAEVVSGEIACATTDDEAAFSSADMVFVTIPAFCMEEAAARIEPYARDGMTVVLVPGTGGAELAFRSCINAGAGVVGLQRVPSVARLVAYGSTVRCEGYREELNIAGMPTSACASVRTLLSQTFGMPCQVLPNYLCVTFTPSNPILHTTRLYSLFKDYHPGIGYERVPLFYEEWDNETSRLLLDCDDELQEICAALPEFDLRGVRSLREHYESATVEELTAKMCSIESLKGLATPTVATPQGLIPDFTSRYFTADFPFGLSLLVQVAELLEVPVSNMQHVLRWYEKTKPLPVAFLSLQKYRINNRNEFVSYYRA